MDDGKGNIQNVDPATLEKLDVVQVYDQAMVDAAVARAGKAWPSWKTTSFAERRRVLGMLMDSVTRHQKEICEMSARDSGKTMLDASLGEIWPVCAKLAYTIKYGERDLSPEVRESGFLMHKKPMVEYLPLGVIGIICPFNFPFHNIYCPLIPVLFAGNAAVLKISEWTSHSLPFYASLIHDVLRRAGYPPDLVQFVTGRGETGAALVNSAVEKIFFTGSPMNGRKVMEAASKTLKPVVLELGGKDPFLVTETADLKQAVASAMQGVFTSCGQMCVSAERLYVYEAVYDCFVSEVVRRAKGLRQGPPLKGQFDLGASTMARQVDIIEDLVNDALAKGARALVGGKRNTSQAGFYFQPTVLVNVNHSMRIMHEEHFGPVMVIMKVRDDAEAIRMANDCPFGLGSSVFTTDSRRALRMARALRSGMTTVNDYGQAYCCQSLPFGGVKISGLGKINGREGLRACTLQKAILADRFPFFRAVLPKAWQVPLELPMMTTFQMSSDAVNLVFRPALIDKARSLSSLVRSTLFQPKAKL